MRYIVSNFFRLVLLVAKVPKTIQDSKTRFPFPQFVVSIHDAQTVAVLKTHFNFSGVIHFDSFTISSPEIIAKSLLYPILYSLL